MNDKLNPCTDCPHHRCCSSKCPKKVAHDFLFKPVSEYHKAKIEEIVERYFNGVK